MQNNEMNNLALKFLNSIRGWVEARIDNRTQGCLRTKIAMIVRKNNNTYDVILSSDYNNFYNDVIYNESTGEVVSEAKDIINEYKNGTITEADYNTAIFKHSTKYALENLITIRSDTYNINDYVTIGYADNKLTNSFIICKNQKEG